MANWCSNAVVFTGEKDGVKSVIGLFQRMAEKEKEENKGQLPDFITANEGYCFDICVIGNVVSYETRWSPNTRVLLQIAGQYNLGFRYQYHEPMNGIEGKIEFKRI